MKDGRREPFTEYDHLTDGDDDTGIARRGYLKGIGATVASAAILVAHGGDVRAASGGYGSGGFGAGAYGGDGLGVSTQTPTGVDATSATLEGDLADLGGADSVDCSFEWRATGDSDWTTTATQTLTTTGTFSEGVDGLSDGEEYEYRAVAEASDGDTATGTTVTFTTTDDPPAVTTGSAASVTDSSATLEGSLDALGNAESVDCSFEWRETGASSWQRTSTQTLSSTGAFGVDVGGLASDTDYEFRALAAASDGDSDTGDTVSLTTETSGSTAPAVDDYTVTEAGSPNPHAEIAADWTVSDADGDLASVLVEVRDAHGAVVADARTAVGGTSAAGTDSFKVKHARNETFDVWLTVTDDEGTTASATRTVTE